MTTYYVLLQVDVGNGDKDPVWHELGTVEARSVDSAKQKMLRQRGLRSGTLWAIPERSHNVEEYEEDVVVRYVKSGGAQLTL